MKLYRQMCRDQKTITKHLIDMCATSNGTASDTLSQGTASSQEPICGNYSDDELKFVQSVREQAVIKILEYGVHLCLKLQTSHIASMFLETWLDKQKKNDLKARRDGGRVWIEECKEFSEKDLRQYLDLITLSCILLAAKTNEQCNAQPSIADAQKIIRGRYSFEEFVEMERFLVVECLDWNLNITTPYHFSDTLQGMGCLFWSDFDHHIKLKVLEKNKEIGLNFQNKMVLFLIEYRKFINYFVEQSLINGLWGNYQHDIIAIASIYLARFEMLDITQTKWKRKPQKEGEYIQLKSVLNERLNVYKRIDSQSLRECVLAIYKAVYDGAVFPFDKVFADALKSLENSAILIASNNYKTDSIKRVLHQINFGERTFNIEPSKSKLGNRALSERREQQTVQGMRANINMQLPSIAQ